MAQKSQNLLCSFLFALSSLLLWSCGLEDIPYIDPIPQGNITQAMNNRAIVRIPVDSPGATFTNFAVFYRIYVSNALLQATTIDSYSSINATLVSDYNNFKNYIDSTTQVNADMDSVFQGRGYKYIGLEDANNNINTVLSETSLGQSLVFDFSSFKKPTMSLGNSTYVLWRSNGGGLFSPRPDRYFVNNRELWNPENISSQINADVVNNANLTNTDRRYTYAAMFIVAVGIDPASYSNIYSTPSLIHVFLLPD